MKTILILISILWFGVALAATSNCPLEVTTKQSFVKKDKGWRTLHDPTKKNTLVSVDFYEGDPMKLQKINADNGATDTLSNWTFADTHKKVWQVCRYAHSSVSLK